MGNMEFYTVITDEDRVCEHCNQWIEGNDSCLVLTIDDDDLYFCSDKCAVEFGEEYEKDD